MSTSKEWLVLQTIHLSKVNNAAFHYLFLSSDYMILRHCFQQSLDNRCAHIAHARARSWTDDAGLPANVREQSRDQRCRQRRRVRRRVTSLVTQQTFWTAATSSRKSRNFLGKRSINKSCFKTLFGIVKRSPCHSTVGGRYRIS